MVMGQDIHIEVTKYNKKTNLYEPIKLYRKIKPNETPYETDENGFREVYIDVGRDYETWNEMKDGGENDGYGIFPWESISYLSLDPVLAEDLSKLEATQGYFDFYEINFSDFKLYLNEHPSVVDYDYDNLDYNGPKPQKENPIKYIFEAIRSYISVADGEYKWTPDSHYKIIFYFDW